MKYEIATIEGSDGTRITIGLDDDHRLCASNGDAIHPKSSSYSDLFSAALGEAKRDIEAMYGSSVWDLQWI